MRGDGPLACGKIVYESRGDARIQAKKMPGGKKPYRCPRCGHWHLGANSKSRKKQIAKKYGGFARRRTDVVE